MLPKLWVFVLLATARGIFPECTGMAPLPPGPEVCYAGPQWGITLTAKLTLAQNRSVKRGNRHYITGVDSRNFSVAEKRATYSVGNGGQNYSTAGDNRNQSRAGIISLSLSWGAVVAQCPEVAFQHHGQLARVQ